MKTRGFIEGVGLVCVVAAVLCAFGVGVLLLMGGVAAAMAGQWGTAACFLAATAGWWWWLATLIVRMLKDSAPTVATAIAAANERYGEGG